MLMSDDFTVSTVFIYGLLTLQKNQNVLILRFWYNFEPKMIKKIYIVTICSKI